MFYDYLQSKLNIAPQVIDLVTKTEKEIANIYANVDDIAAINQLKILTAMQDCRLSDTHFNDSTGYGYNDEGRETLERIYAKVFKTEAALVRSQFVSGTHALATALFGNLRPGDTLLSPVGAPYDTLESVIGIRPSSGSLAEMGVNYHQIDLLKNNAFNYEEIQSYLQTKPKMATIQRSKGYSWRPSFTVNQLQELIACIRNISPHTIILVDNCYGEFVQTEEPSDADLIVGSLIKNPGGGLATVGGYVAGKSVYVEKAAERLTAPGIGSAVGPSLGTTRTILQGLFLAPQTVSASIIGAILTAALFSRLGFDVNPTETDTRTDIVQAIKLKTAENVLAFCEAIQRAAPVDGYVTPVPAPMPGYGHDVIMAGGTFIQGSSIELSADAPIRPPYIAYFQGGLTPAHSRLGAICAVNALYKIGAIEL